VPLRIWSSREDLPDGEPHVLALTPFWGRDNDPARPRPEYADALVESGRSVLDLVELADADVAVFPRDWKRAREDGTGQLETFVARAREAGKPALVYWQSDASDPFPVDGATVLRPSLFRSRRRPRELALPGFHEDLVAYCGGTLPIREKRERATVSFCGYAPAPPGRRRGAGARLRRVAGDLRRGAAVRRGVPLEEDRYVRWRALRELEAQDAVDTAFLRREDFGGGAVFPELDVERWQAARLEFVASVRANDYVLCARGGGNWSYRLYETLCLGRIPVFVDTDCVLPWDEEVDWPSHGVWLDRRDLGSLGERIAAFHEALSPDAFVALQRRNRALWEEWLSPLGFHRKLAPLFGATP
jgi:hypothetical protein